MHSRNEKTETVTVEQTRQWDGLQVRKSEKQWNENTEGIGTCSHNAENWHCKGRAVPGDENFAFCSFPLLSGSDMEMLNKYVQIIRIEETKRLWFHPIDVEIIQDDTNDQSKGKFKCQCVQSFQESDLNISR